MDINELKDILSREDVIDCILDPPDELIAAIPEIAPLVGLDQNHPNHQYDAWGHIAYSVAAASGDSIVRLTLLFHDIGKGDVLKSGEGGFNFNGHMELGAYIARKRLTELGADPATVHLVSELVGIHDINIEDGEVSGWLERLGEKNLRRWFEIKRGDMIAHTDPYRTEMLALVDRNEAELDQILSGSRT
ncbi:MAG: HD domain-containing protein [Clostridiales Family XIII bacterium]|jgi:tRNA nucleotidyltransferase (CCA-adding enzyme)|nr:HD domain-containing protein [Clostridiales Family XIII bacterium]